MPVENQEICLIIEDDETLREITATYLEKKGFKILQAGTGEEGLKILREQYGRVTHVLCDLLIPPMNGHEVLKHARAAGFDDLIFVIISGNLKPSMIVELAKGKVDGLLCKPFPMEVISTEFKLAQDRNDRRKILRMANDPNFKLAN